MAGQTNGQFREKLSPFLSKTYDELRASEQAGSAALRAIELQYFQDAREANVADAESTRHYEAELRPIYEGKPLRGVERLYRRTIIIEPTMLCAAHCRWCVRGLYEIAHLSNEEMERIARYCGESPDNAEVREVLITGGDPLTSAEQLEVLLAALVRHAPRIQYYRIATRVPLQEPALVDERLQGLLRLHRERIEIALHVNHPEELFPETLQALERIQDAGVRIYNQSVLLRGLNDDFETLAELSDALRALRIETHYLFHCSPIRGMRHHRTSVRKGLELIAQLTSNGFFSGRAKPMFTLLTDVGKITPYEGTILDRQGDRLLLQSSYRYSDRIKYNPCWRLPESAVVDEKGLLRVWYEDAPADPPE